MLTPIFVHSWTLENMLGAEWQRSLVFENIKKLKLDMPKTPPPKKIVDAIEDTLTSIDKVLCEEGVPFFLVIFSNMSDLTTWSKILPVSFALSTLRSVAVTSIDQLMKLFHSRVPYGDFDDTPDGWCLTRIEKANFLLVERIDDKVFGASKNSGKFSSLFSDRLYKKLPTVFTWCCPDFDSSNPSDFIQALERSVQTCLGGNVLATLSQNWKILFYGGSSC